MLDSPAEQATAAIGKPFTFDGLWEWWGGPDGKAPVEFCTILTTDANELASEVHNRMPIILDADDYDDWAGGRGDPARAVRFGANGGEAQV